MGKDLWIEHIALMLRSLSENAIRAVYMVVKEFYSMSHPLEQE